MPRAHGERAEGDAEAKRECTSEGARIVVVTASEERVARLCQNVTFSLLLLRFFFFFAESRVLFWGRRKWGCVWVWARGRAFWWELEWSLGLNKFF